jgi:hypothetical protein
MIQNVLDEGLVTLQNEDQRGLTPLFWSNVAPYGEIRLNMTNRLALRDTISSPNPTVPNSPKAGPRATIRTPTTTIKDSPR